MAGLAAEDAHLVSVRIGDLDDLRVELRVATDGALAPDRPNAKLMAGLALQLEASVREPGCGDDHSMAVSGRAASRSKCE